MRVAIAAPTMPSSGKPHSPKMSRKFQTMFQTLPMSIAHIATLVCVMLSKKLLNALLTPTNINDGMVHQKYCSIKGSSSFGCPRMLTSANTAMSTAMPMSDTKKMLNSPFFSTLPHSSVSFLPYADPLSGMMPKENPITITDTSVKRLFTNPAAASARVS